MAADRFTRPAVASDTPTMMNCTASAARIRPSTRTMIIIPTLPSSREIGPAARKAKRMVRQVAAMAATLKGIDVLVFTAGIGENSPEIRKRVCRAGEWLGLALDEQANAANRLKISAEESRVAIFAIPTDEEIVIARHTRDLLRGAAA